MTRTAEGTAAAIPVTATKAAAANTSFGSDAEVSNSKASTTRAIASAPKPPSSSPPTTSAAARDTTIANRLLGAAQTAIRTANSRRQPWASCAVTP